VTPEAARPTAERRSSRRHRPTRGAPPITGHRIPPNARGRVGRRAAEGRARAPSSSAGTGHVDPRGRAGRDGEQHVLGGQLGVGAREHEVCADRGVAFGGRFDLVAVNGLARLADRVEELDVAVERVVERAKPTGSPVCSSRWLSRAAASDLDDRHGRPSLGGMAPRAPGGASREFVNRRRGGGSRSRLSQGVVERRGHRR
jgi:hypothetical protein